MWPLSKAPVWQRQRQFYEDRASAAFAEIPHHAVDNPFIAAAYARVIEAFAPSGPLTILELGAGPGRFAYNLARELGDRDFLYVLSDFAESQLEDWQRHPGLADQRFDFATLDLTRGDPVELRRRATTLHADTLVIVANYVFDSIPADAFAVQDGVLEACLVDGEFNYTRAPVSTPHYGDPELDALLEHYRTTLDDTVFTIPTTAIRALRALTADRTLVLAADKSLNTEESLGYRGEPRPALHGDAFSLMVNVHALGLFAERHHGELHHGGDRHAALDVSALVIPPHEPTRAAYEHALARFGPGDLATLTIGIERAAEHLGVAELVALLRLSGYDASTLQCVLGALREQAAEADPATQEDLRHALFETYERHFSVPGDPDLPFAIGLLLYELEDYEDAIAFFEASLEQHGPDPATEKNIELCEAMLG